MTDAAVLLLSGIQHYAFCPRQWGLIYLEQQWAHNHLTIGGKILHAKVHENNKPEKRGDQIIYRGLIVASQALGLSGVCDVVEFNRDESGVPLHGFQGFWAPTPVEYKHGKSKANDCDRLQLCAQAVCLEEMLCTAIPEGALFYGESRHRELVPFTLELRNKLYNMVKVMHTLAERKHTPKATPGKFCQSCSINDLCLPHVQDGCKGRVQTYMEAHMP